MQHTVIIVAACGVKRTWNIEKCASSMQFWALIEVWIKSAVLVPASMPSKPALKLEPLKPNDPDLQMSLMVLAHERLCLSCWMGEIIPYLLPKLRLIWWFSASFVRFLFLNRTFISTQLFTNKLEERCALLGCHFERLSVWPGVDRNCIPRWGFQGLPPTSWPQVVMMEPKSYEPLMDGTRGKTAQLHGLWSSRSLNLAWGFALFSPRGLAKYIARTSYCQDVFILDSKWCTIFYNNTCDIKIVFCACYNGTCIVGVH